MYPLVFFGLAVIATIIHLVISKNYSKENVITLSLMYYVIFCIGAQGVFAAIGHLFFYTEIDKQIGWAWSPFQREIGFTNLGIGVAGLMAIFWKGKYWLGPIITYLIFLYGAAYGHFVELSKGDTGAYNSGIFLYVGDLGLPTLCLILTFLYYFLVLKKSPSIN